MRTGPTGERLGLGDRLLAARRRRRLRQLDAAREIGVCRETVARVEVDHIPSQATRAKVLGWLEVQEGVVVAELAAAKASAVRAAAADRIARARERRAAAKRLGGRKLRALARLAVRRRTARAFRAAATNDRKVGEP